MEGTGKLTGITRDLQTGRWLMTFSFDRLPQYTDINGEEEIDVTAKKHRNRRSKNANALLWECLGRIAAELKADKWDVYLNMLKSYGEYTYVCVKPHAVEMLKRQWRECEELGPISINGQTAVQMLCIYGSSTYDTKQFSRLLDGVISEMEQMGMETPMPEQTRAALEVWNEQTKQGL